MLHPDVALGFILQILNNKYYLHKGWDSNAR